MIYVLSISIFALIAALATFLSGRGLAGDIRDIRQVVGRGVPVNLAAFRQLFDARDTDFLRRHLSLHDLRRVQRLRLRAGLDYLSAIFANTAILIRVAELAQTTRHVDVAAAGTRLLNVAIRVRLLTSVAIARALLCYCWPGLSCSNDSLIDAYESLRMQVGVVVRMQAPAETSRLTAAI